MITLGIKQKVSHGTIKTLELAVAAIIGAFASQLIVPLFSMKGWPSKIEYGFLAAAALLCYCALALFFIYLVEWLVRRNDERMKIVEE